jgi:hypothetical protein
MKTGRIAIAAMTIFVPIALPPAMNMTGCVHSICPPVRGFRPFRGE